MDDLFFSTVPKNWRDGDVIINGLKLHYYRMGVGKRALVFSHGLTDNGLCWNRAVEELAQDYDLIMVDARGHGMSDKPKSGYSPNDHAADLAGFINALQIEDPVVIGHSMGGMTAALVAAKYPDIIRGAILEDPPWRDTVDGNLSGDIEGEVIGFHQWVQGLKSLSVEDIKNLGMNLNPNWSQDEYPAWAESKKQVAVQTKDYIKDTTINWRDVVKEIQVPVFLITGDVNDGQPGSGIVSPAVSRQAESLNPLLTTVNIPGAGHNIRREQFDAFMVAVKQYLSDLDG